MVETKSISARLKDIRSYYGYKQTEIARKLGICRNAYCEYEHYKRIIPMKRLIHLANFYGINIDYLLGLTDSKEVLNATEIDRQIISNRLSEVRRTNNLSITELANSLNVSRTLISNYEYGKQLISTSVCYDIAKKYNISVDYLLGISSRKHLKK